MTPAQKKRLHRDAVYYLRSQGGDATDANAIDAKKPIVIWDMIREAESDVEEWLENPPKDLRQTNLFVAAVARLSLLIAARERM